MRKVLKWIGILLASILGLAVLVAAGVFAITSQRINQRYDIPVEVTSIPTDEASIQRGEHLISTILLCTECHLENFSGQTFDEGAVIGRIAMSNLTRGKGGIGATYKDEDWVRAIRHGVGKDGKTLITMPSNDLNFLSNEDLYAVIAYLKTLPPVDKDLPGTRLGPVGRFFVLMEPDLLPASVIDHDQPAPPYVQPDVSVEYGKYLANNCQICHGEDLSGRDVLGGGVNLTPGGELGSWTFQDFKKTMRTGFTPNLVYLEPDLMPWRSLGKLTDEELQAIWMYLQTLPPVEDPPPDTAEESGD